MDVHASATGPALPLGIAVTAAVLAVLVVAGLLRAGRPTTSARPAGVPEDDLPSFREHPPGSPGSRPVPVGPATAPPRSARPGRALALMALAALLLVAAVAAVAAGSDGGPRPAPRTTAPATGTAAPSSAPLPPVPAAPSSGQPGAGRLAGTSVPLGDDGMTARLAFAGVVLEQRAVGITATYPAVRVTVGDDGTALASVQLPTWNCLADRPPADPGTAGCRAAVPEFAELPSPALRVTREGTGWRLQGRFPTYTRPNGTGPLYTGRVYELEVTVRPGPELSDGWSAAAGEVRLGSDRAAARDEDGLSVLRTGG